jgi:hypothetical protein
MTDELLTPLLVRLNPSRIDLMSRLARLLDQSMIKDIARADYGYGEEENVAVIQEICRTHEVPKPLEWEPGEVMALVRWSRPEDPDWGPGGHGRRGHIMRAFCCASLLHDPHRGAGNSNDSVARLIQSCHELGEELLQLASAFLAWCLMETEPCDEDRPFHVLGVIIALAGRPGDEHDADLINRLIYWLELEVQRLSNDDVMTWGDRWLRDITNHDQSIDIWVDNAQRLLVDRRASHPPACAAQVQALGRKICSEFTRRRQKKPWR